MDKKQHMKLQGSGYVSANGLRIYFESVGDGYPLILLHGGSCTTTMWRGVVPAFAQYFQVIAIDSRGHGKTDNPSGKITYRLMADDVAAFIRATGLTKPLLCGYSDGGQILLEFGMHYPGLGQALVPGGVYRELTEERKKNFAEALGITGPGAVNFDGILAHNPDFVEFCKTAHATPADPERWRVMYEQLSGCWYEPMNHKQADLQRIQEPTLIIMGDRDEFVTVEEGASMAKDIPKGEFAVIPNGGHVSTVGPENLFDLQVSSVSSNPVFEQAVIDFCMRHTRDF